ncbi:flagellar hook-basal body complex protein [Sulfurospirillum sp. SCADC]|uniref:flagellar hook-basal body complex protein n=2 Tax=Sulfurospirillum TaxID=57665 RepID=UPI0025F38B56|nr:flagellar hook-basal body complex protein [Sulfurospirillum sp. SCADC]
MRALWAGVTGLQAHQIAMDTESNNIANVNTTGYKYSRANFATLLSQTTSIATSPTGTLGGQNATQIGLGTTIATVSKIFSQGSIETTDKTTDLAISGSGFFVVSPDAGTTYKYTRNGDFEFDADGNFVDGNGYIVQGWLKDESTGLIDTTSPITNVTIAPGLTTPASATTKVTVKATLDSGTSVGTNKTSIYSLDSNSGWVDTNGDGVRQTTEIHNEDDTGDNIFDTDSDLIERGVDFSVLFDSDGEALGVTEGQGMWVSYATAKTSFNITADTSGTTTINMTINGTTISGSISSSDDDDVAAYIASLINAQKASTGVEATVSSGNKITLSNDNSTGTTDATKNIKLVQGSTNSAVGITDTEVNTAYQYTYTSSASSSNPSYDDGVARTFTTTEDLRDAMQTDARLYVDYTGDGTADLNDGASVSVNTSGQFVISNPTGDAYNTDDGDYIETEIVTEAKFNELLESSSLTLPEDSVLPAGDYTFTTDVTINGTTYAAGVTHTFATAITLDSAVTIPQGTTADFIPAVTTIALLAGTNTAQATFTETSLNYALTNKDIALSSGSILPAGDYTFNNDVVINGVTYTAGTHTLSATTLSSDLTIPQGSSVAFASTSSTVTPGGDFGLYLTVTNLTNATNSVSANSDLTAIFSALQGTLSAGSTTRTSGDLYMASLSSTTDIYDSLGSKHTLTINYVKTGTTSSGGTEWSMTISVPEPGELNSGVSPENIVTGTISFNSDGSLATYSPRTLNYTANNGSTANQAISLNMGTLGQFDGLKSLDNDSSTSSITQDGYAGGDLSGISVDETGTIIGSFSNGYSFALAQVAMATFTNESGLESDGGNCYIASTNSGTATVGQASTGTKGSIQSSALEMSNVDLSRSLTQLIVIQRGYQANSKTITTADEMLNTLLQLK